MMNRSLMVLAAAAAGVLLVAQPAQAYWRGGVWIDVPLVVPAPYYSPYYAAPYPYAYPQAPVVVQPPPAQTVEPAQAAPAPTWYWCAASRAYYPYVHDCAGGWQAVPAGVAPPSAAPPAQNPSTP